MKIKTNIIKNTNNDLRFLALSDIHIHSLYDKRLLNNIINNLNNKNYDAIFIVGDLLDSVDILDNINIKNMIINFIKYLTNYSNVYYVLGNHDFYDIKNNKKNYNMNKTINFIHNLKISKFYFLNNETIYLNKNCTISGLNIGLNYADDKERYYSNIDITFINKLNKDNYNILLCHYPNTIIDLNNKSSLNNINLSIAGHTHNGGTQFKFLPVEFILNLFKQKNRGIITPSKSFKNTKYLRGKILFENNRLLIINPAIRTLSYLSKLRLFDFLFYKGATEIILEK